MKGKVIKSLFINYLHQQLQHDGWQQKRQLIYDEIKGGLLKGFWFDSSGFSANTFRCIGFVMPLYVPAHSLTLSYGHTVPNPQKRDWWKLEEQMLEQTAMDLAPAMNRVQKEFLSKIKDAEDFYDQFKRDRKKEIHFYEAVSYSALYADLRKADKVLNQFFSFLKKHPDLQYDWAQRIQENTEKLLQGNREQRKALLEEWAAGTQAAIL